MKTYEAVFTDDPSHGVYGISCVDRPAMQDEWITLSEQPREIQFEAVDEEKQILLGAILIPNKKVYRNIDGHEFYLMFSEKTIWDLSHAYIERGNQKKSSVNHDKPLEGVCLVETWTVADPNQDKSAVYGKRYEKGTWVGMMHVDKETYTQAKEGKLTGFSIDALMPLKEINFNEMSDTKSIIKSVLAELGMGKTEKVEMKIEKVTFGQLKLSDKKTKISFEGDAPEVGKPVFLLNAEGERNRVPEGTLELENGEKIFIDKNGLVTDQEPEEKKAEEAPEESVAEPKQEEKVEMSAEKIAEAIATQLSSELEKIREENKAALKLRDDKIENLEKELSNPAAEAIVPQMLAIEEPKTSKDRLMNAALMALKQN